MTKMLLIINTEFVINSYFKRSIVRYILFIMYNNHIIEFLTESVELLKKLHYINEIFISKDYYYADCYM